MPTPNRETSPSGREYTAFSIGRGYGSKIFGRCSARLFLGRTQRPLCIQDLELPKSLQRKRLGLSIIWSTPKLLTCAGRSLFWKAARKQEQAEKDQSVMFAAETRALPWSLRCVDLLDFANPPCPLMLPESIPRGRPSLEDRL